jgi:regulator of cell morphogenesis and NO signaling
MLNEKLHIPLYDLVSENPKLGFVLHTQGIKFYEHAHRSVSAISQEYAFNLEQFKRQINWQSQYQLFQDPLLFSKFSAEKVMQYLQYMHRIFVKDKLPYFANLVSDSQHASDDRLMADLKWVFPYFQEDFVKHILEEEEHLFAYVRNMQKALLNKNAPSALIMEMESKSIKDYALQHSLDDDDMVGIRSLTNQYNPTAKDSLAIRVLYYELQEFEKELQFHARVENEVLFPKAYSIENQLRAIIHKQTFCN